MSNIISGTEYYNLKKFNKDYFRGIVRLTIEEFLLINETYKQYPSLEYKYGQQDVLEFALRQQEKFQDVV